MPITSFYVVRSPGTGPFDTRRGTIEACFEFKSDATVAASHVKFLIAYFDGSGNAIGGFDPLDVNILTPAGADNQHACRAIPNTSFLVERLAIPEDNFNAWSKQIVLGGVGGWVERVDYADGTSWNAIKP
jgi:hypothetical protein